VVCGCNGVQQNEVWEYTPTSNTWLQKNNFPGIARWSAPCFEIANKGYLMLGVSPNLESDVWEYEPLTDTWTQKNNFPGFVRQDAFGFAINTKGYVTCGRAGGYLNDLWEYTPATDTWLQKADFPAMVRNGASGFVIGNYAYVGLRYNSGTNFSDFYRYNPATIVWNSIASYPGAARNSSAHFSLGGNGYVGLGYDGNSYFNDFYKYDPTSNTCAIINNFENHETRTYPAFFTTANAPYIGTGSSSSLTYLNDFYKYSIPFSSITETTISQIQISPNPANNFVAVTLGNSQDINAINVFDVLGNKVKSNIQNIKSKIEINTTSLSNGVYFVEVITDENTYSKKIIANH